MSLSRIIKFAGVTTFLILPFTADGAELKFADQTWEVEPRVGVTQQAYIVRNDFDLKTFVRQSFTSKPYSTTARSLDAETIKTLEEIADELNQENKPAKLVIEGNFAKEFEPGQDGQSVDVYRAYKMLGAGEDRISLPVLVSKSNSSLSATNNLGINELIATGESDFAGSPRNRRVNIAVGTSRYQGLILKPGEEFSFNKFLGDVDAEHGFLPELVIKRTGTVPEFGGGLCQVSSTVFRAAMKAGLPIVERRNHSYAVKYYAPQGTDATIYPGVTDFRFTNDLSSHLLIRTRIEGDKLYFDFYGTKDDRKVVLDDPYSYDKKANGAMKATWSRTVTKDGKESKQTFNSNYQPPALFQVATQASTPNPESNPNTTNPNPAPSDPNNPNPAPNPSPETPTETPTPNPTPSA